MITKYNIIPGGRLEGNNIYLRPINVNDAEDLLKIRLDEDKNQFVHKVPNDIELEKKWILQQQEAPDDYFFAIIRKKDNSFVGSVGITAIDRKNFSCELGRWMSYGTPVENLESIIRAYDFAYNILCMNNIHTKTMMDNHKVVNFWKRFGGTAVENVPVQDYYVYDNVVEKSEYLDNIRPKFIKLIGG